jgi:hypothetical protein
MNEFENYPDFMEGYIGDSEYWYDSYMDMEMSPEEARVKRERWYTKFYQDIRDDKIINYDRNGYMPVCISIDNSVRNGETNDIIDKIFSLLRYKKPLFAKRINDVENYVIDTISKDSARGAQLNHGVSPVGYGNVRLPYDIPNRQRAYLTSETPDGPVKLMYMPLLERTSRAWAYDDVEGDNEAVELVSEIQSCMRCIHFATSLLMDDLYMKLRTVTNQIFKIEFYLLQNPEIVIKNTSQGRALKSVLLMTLGISHLRLVNQMRVHAHELYHMNFIDNMTYYDTHWMPNTYLYLI